MRRIVLLLAILMSAFTFPAMAKEAVTSAPDKAPASDPQIKRQLEELKYTYKIDEDGDYKLVFEIDDSPDKRSQIVFVRSPVETYGQQNIREIWSPGYQSKEKDKTFPATVANRLLEASMASKLGAWAKQEDYAMFVVKLSANASTKELDDAVEVAFRSADAMEVELTPGKDEF